jgi:hypothetical protein
MYPMAFFIRVAILEVLISHVREYLTLVEVVVVGAVARLMSRIGSELVATK